jgi:hypothetical protein
LLEAIGLPCTVRNAVMPCCRLAFAVADMAIWQFELAPIPAAVAEVRARDGDSDHKLELAAPERAALFFRLSAILPPAPAWDEAMRLWGDEKRDDIAFFMSDTGIEGLRIRVDVRNLSTSLVRAICNLASDFGWVFLSEAGEIIQPSPEAVLDAIARSPASEYVRDPSGFLGRIARPHQGRC